MDTYMPTEALQLFKTSLAAGLFSRVASMVQLDFTMISALGTYLRIFEDWTPTENATPTLCLWASQPPSIEENGKPLEGYDTHPSWPLPHRVIDVPGNHFDMLVSDHALSTAAQVHEWLAGRS
ncbi:hypothetical protein ACFQ2B_39090 [Streptomyces stramineus]